MYCICLYNRKDNNSNYTICVTVKWFYLWQTVEEELESVGENMKVLEKSSEKALEREEKLKDKILQIQYKFKAAEAR